LLFLVLTEFFFCTSISLTLFYFRPLFLSYRKKEMSFLLCSDKNFLLSYSFSVLFNSISLSLLCFLLYLCVFVLLHFCLPVCLTRQHSGSLLLMRNTGSITFATKAHILYQRL
jgi:hypothetical protein